MQLSDDGCFVVFGTTAPPIATYAAPIVCHNNASEWEPRALARGTKLAKLLKDAGISVDTKFILLEANSSRVLNLVDWCEGFAVTAVSHWKAQPEFALAPQTCNETYPLTFGLPMPASVTLYGNATVTLPNANICTNTTMKGNLKCNTVAFFCEGSAVTLLCAEQTVNVVSS